MKQGKLDGLDVTVELKILGFSSRGITFTEVRYLVLVAMAKSSFSNKDNIDTDMSWEIFLHLWQRTWDLAHLLKQKSTGTILSWQSGRGNFLHLFQ